MTDIFISSRTVFGGINSISKAATKVSASPLCALPSAGFRLRAEVKHCLAASIAAGVLRKREPGSQIAQLSDLLRTGAALIGHARVTAKLGNIAAFGNGN